MNWNGNWLASKASSRDIEKPSTLICMMFREMPPPSTSNAMDAKINDNMVFSSRDRGTWPFLRAS